MRVDCVLCSKVWVVSVCAVTVSSCEAGADTEANCLPWLLVSVFVFVLFVFVSLFVIIFQMFNILRGATGGSVFLDFSDNKAHVGKVPHIAWKKQMIWYE